MEIYIKGKFEFGVGSAAYVVVREGVEVARGSKQLGDSFDVGGGHFPCDSFNCEVLAAICGVARCKDDKLLNIYTNNKSIISWLYRGKEPEGRKNLMDVYRRFADGKDVHVDYIPFYEKDPSGNPWNAECEKLARMALRGR